MNNSCHNCSHIFDTTGIPAFCPKCGTQQNTKKEIPKNNKCCSKCGHSNLIEAHYCTECGADLKQYLTE